MRRQTAQSLSDMQDTVKLHPVSFWTASLGVLALSIFIVTPTVRYWRTTPVVTLVADTRLVDIHGGSGGMLKLLISKDKPAPCSGDITRVLWRWNTDFNNRHLREIYHFDYRGSGDPFPNELQFILDLPITAKLMEENWHYSSFYAKKCSLLAYWFPEPLPKESDVPVLTDAPVR